MTILGVRQYSTTPASNTDINGINIAENCSPANINNAIRQEMADLAQYLATGAYAVDSGAVNALVITLNPIPPSMASLTGAPLIIVPAYTNTGAATIAVNGLTAVPITSPSGGALAAGSLVAGSPTQVVFSGTNMILLNTPAPALLVGSGQPWFSNTLPSKYIWGNGSLISRTTYSVLFTLWGSSFGAGDGSTTFGTPDLRGVTLAGADAMGGAAAANRLTSTSLGASATLGVIGGNQLPQIHNHGVNDYGHVHSIAGSWLGGSGAVSGAVSGGGVSLNQGATNLQSTGISIQSSFAGTSQNVQPTFVCNYIIFAGV